METLKLPITGDSVWAGMNDYLLLSPDGRNKIELLYEGEPPHGDSYHQLKVNGKEFPGHAWGCMFSFSSNSRYLVCGWMEKFIERKTVVIDCDEQRYYVTPNYIYNFIFVWPEIKGVGEKYEKLSYRFDGNEEWVKF